VSGWAGAAGVYVASDHREVNSTMSDDNTIELNRRRVLGGLVTVGGAAAAAGAGTFALFNDTETSTGNSVTAGTLDLTEGGSDLLTFSESNIAPTDTGSAYTTLQNTGNTAGNLSISVTGISSNEGSGTEFNDGGDGELDDQLELQLWVDTGDDGTFDSSSDIGLENSTDTTSSSRSYYTASTFSNVSWSDVITGWTGTARFYVDWDFPDLGNTNNNAQGDDITVDFEFDLVQQ